MGLMILKSLSAINPDYYLEERKTKAVPPNSRFIISDASQ